MSGRAWFWVCAGASLALQALLLFALAPAPLHGGADLLPHLHLVQKMAEEPALRSVYPPAYHALGALLAPVVGLAVYAKLFALAGTGAFIAGFRFFQRSTGLPDESAALFALSPYLLALAWCMPKIEAAGYALALAGLGFAARRRAVPLALCLLGAFLVHTATALFLGLTAGVFCLVRRDARGLAALALGSLAAAPLLAAHLAAGCDLAQAFLFSEDDYLRSEPLWSLRVWDAVVVLAAPHAVLLGVLGAPLLWRRNRAVAILCGVILVLYLNELWLAPFGRGTTLNLLRGLSVLAIPVSACAGVALEQRRRLVPWVLGFGLLWLLAAARGTLPLAGSADPADAAGRCGLSRACYVRPISLSELRGMRVGRCVFRWSGPRIHRPGPPRDPAAQGTRR